MKKTGIILLACMPAAISLFLTCASCTKKEDALKNAAVRETHMTPEQTKQLEEVKRGVEESKRLVVARVNGSDITMYSLVREMNVMAPDIVPAGQQATPEITAKVKKKALDNLIFKELALQQAAKEGITVKPGVVDDVVLKVKKQTGTKEAYEKYLQDRNLDEDGLRKSIERSHLFETITAREIFDTIETDDKTLRDRYLKEKASLVTKDVPPRQLSFEEAKGFLLKKIKSEKSIDKMKQWNKQMREKAKIEVTPLFSQN